MTLFCLACIVGTFATGIGPGPLREAAGVIVVPFQNSIHAISDYFQGARQNMRSKEDLIAENEDLKMQVENLTGEINILVQDQEELRRLQALYDLDQEYSNYPKIAARIISKDPGNWYDTFMINRGSRDGVRVDNNVIAGKGLVGIVTEVGSTWATVRSIIDDSSSVSAMTVSTADNFIVQGDLELIDEGKLHFVELYDRDGKVTTGEQCVTSNISEKYLEGLFIGYISEVEQDTNNLTKTGTIVTPVDFRHLRDVFVITRNKQDAFTDTGKGSGVNAGTDAADSGDTGTASGTAEDASAGADSDGNTQTEEAETAGDTNADGDGADITETGTEDADSAGTGSDASAGEEGIEEAGSTAQDTGDSTEGTSDGETGSEAMSDEEMNGSEE